MSLNLKGERSKMKTANGECRDMDSHGLHAMEQGHADSGIQWIPSRNWADLGAIAFRLPMLPDQEFTLIFPEWFAARETSWHAPCRWSNPPETGVWEDGNGEATVRLRCMATGFGATLAWEYRFENRGARTLTDLAAFQCFNLDGAPLFKDLMMERTWYCDRQGAPVGLSGVKKNQGPGSRTMQFYPASRGIDLTRIAKIQAYGVTSPAKLTGDRLGVDSLDGRWQVQTVVDGPVAFFFNNWEPDHGCVHASPLLGTLAPGAVASAKGRIVICRLP